MPLFTANPDTITIPTKSPLSQGNRKKALINKGKARDTGIIRVRIMALKFSIRARNSKKIPIMLNTKEAQRTVYFFL